MAWAPSNDTSPASAELGVEPQIHPVESLGSRIMAAAPTVPLAAGLALGIVLAERSACSLIMFLYLLAASSAAAVLAAVRVRAGLVLIFLAAVGVGGILHWSRVEVADPSSIAHLLADGDTVVRVRGVVASQPATYARDKSAFAAWEFRGETTSFLLDVQQVEADLDWVVASGLVKVSIQEPVLDLAEGDWVEIFGRLSALRPPMNPGGFDWRGYYRLQGIVSRLYCDQRENIVRIERRGPDLVSWLRTKTRGLLSDDIAASAPEEASFLDAMVLGHRSRFDRRLNDVFTRAGCVHFIAASGTNIVILMGAVWLVGRLVGLDKRRCAWVMMSAIVVYGLLAEGRPPILRACVMGLLFCVALLFQRASSHLNWIALAAIALCLIDPLMIFDAGFQLSFAAVFGVAYVAPAIWRGAWQCYWRFREGFLQDKYVRADQQLEKVALRFAPIHGIVRLQRGFAKLTKAVGLVCAVSLGAWLSGVPITAAWFQQVQPWGVASSVVVYPLMSVIMLLGLIKVGVAAISPTLASLLGEVLGYIDGLMIAVVEWFAALPASSLTVPPPPWWVIASFYLVLLAVAAGFRSESYDDSVGSAKEKEMAQQRGTRWTNGWIGLVSVLFVFSAGAWRLHASHPRGLTVTVLSVGAGSAMVIELPNGQALIYDAGSSGVPHVGSNVLAPFLRYRGITVVDKIFVSHPNLDHFSGIPELVREVAAGPVCWNHCFAPLSPSRSPAAELIKVLNEHGHPIDQLSTNFSQWEQGGVGFELLWPMDAHCADLSANDSSTVLRLSYAGRSILLTGDIENTAQRALIARGEIHADVLVLPHHGSVCTSTASFLGAVGAEILVRSSGQPTAQTDNGLVEMTSKAAMYNTADVGAVTVTIDESGIEVTPWLASPLR